MGFSIQKRRSERSRYLTAALLEGKQVGATIKSVQEEKVMNPRTKAAEVKLVMYFEGKEKGLILSAGNENMLAALFGDNTDDWIGANVILYPNREFIAGENKEIVRIKQSSQEVTMEDVKEVFG